MGRKKIEEEERKIERRIKKKGRNRERERERDQKRTILTITGNEVVNVTTVEYPQKDWE